MKVVHKETLLWAETQKTYLSFYISALKKDNSCLGISNFILATLQCLSRNVKYQYHVYNYQDLHTLTLWCSLAKWNIMPWSSVAVSRNWVHNITLAAHNWVMSLVPFCIRSSSLSISLILSMIFWSFWWQSICSVGVEVWL